MTGSSEQRPDPGLACLALLLRFHGVAADPEQISMLRHARGLGLKARLVTCNWERLEKVRLPAIAVLSDGGFLLLGKVTSDDALVQDVRDVRTEARFSLPIGAYLILEGAICGSLGERNFSVGPIA